MITAGEDNEDTLRTALQASIEQEYEPRLAEAIEHAKHEHQLRVEKALDAAVLAIRGKTATPAAKAKKARKPRSNKGTKRGKRGLPEPPADAGEACAECEHYASWHNQDTGECGIKGCECKAFVSPSDEPAF